MKWKQKEKKPGFKQSNRNLDLIGVILLSEKKLVMLPTEKKSINHNHRLGNRNLKRILIVSFSRKKNENSKEKRKFSQFTWNWMWKFFSFDGFILIFLGQVIHINQSWQTNKTKKVSIHNVYIYCMVLLVFHPGTHISLWKQKT